MYFPYSGTKDKGEVNKLRFSALAAASLMNLLKKQRDAFGLSTFTDKIEQHSRCKSSTTHYKRLLTYLDTALANPMPDKTTAATDALHEIADSIHKRSMVIIFSDMLEQSDDPEQIFSALQHLRHNKHEVILFHVVDKSKEIDFEFENRPYMFVDLETGEEIRLQSNQVKDYYKEKMVKFKKDLELKCLQYKIDFVEADINQGFRQVLLPYLVKRSKMRT